MLNECDSRGKRQACPKDSPFLHPPTVLHSRTFTQTPSSSLASIRISSLFAPSCASRILSSAVSQLSCRSVPRHTCSARSATACKTPALEPSIFPQPRPRASESREAAGHVQQTVAGIFNHMDSQYRCIWRACFASAHVNCDEGQASINCLATVTYVR